MSVVDVEHGIVLQRHLLQLGKGRQGAAHAVNPVDGRQGAAIGSGSLENPLQLHGIAVSKRGDARPVRLGDLDPFLNRVVRILIDYQEVLLAD